MRSPRIDNSGATPRFHTAFLKARRLGEMLSEVGLDRAITLAKEAGLLRLFGTRPDPPRMTDASRARLRDSYRNEIAALEQLLGRPIVAWQQRT